MNYKIKKDIPIIFHNGSIYDYHLIIKELVKELEGEFECLGENTEKYITFSVPINKKIAKKDRDGNRKIENIPCRLKFIDSYRFMSASLSNLVDNLSNGLHKCKNCESSLEYINAEDSKVVFKCLNCNKDYNKDFNKELKEHITYYLLIYLKILDIKALKHISLIMLIFYHYQGLLASLLKNGWSRIRITYVT